MKNAIILGVPRSGTSLAASLFRNAGYHMGDSPVTPTESNPKGYFEDHKVNNINNKILREIGVAPKKLPLRTTSKLLKCIGIKSKKFDIRTWAHLTPKYPTTSNVSSDTFEAMREFIEHEHFCYKDPRFTYTLSVWEKLLTENTRFLVVFRSPSDTVHSMLRNASTIYSPPLPLTRSYCELVYSHNYRQLINTYSENPRFIFCHYDKILDGSDLASIECCFDTKLNAELVDENLARSRSQKKTATTSVECKQVYEQLVDVAKAKLN